MDGGQSSLTLLDAFSEKLEIGQQDEHEEEKVLDLQILDQTEEVAAKVEDAEPVEQQAQPDCNSIECPRCNGTKQTKKGKPCRKCQGNGFVQTQLNITDLKEHIATEI